MKGPKLIFTVAAGVLGALAVADAMQVARPSGLAAAACTVELFRGKPDADALVARYQSTIEEQAEDKDLPPELLAAVIANHQAYMTTFRRFTDCFGSAVGANLSLGLAQLRISTAARVDGTFIDQLSPSEFRRLRADLLDPIQNIVYQAREFRSLADREHRFPGIKADKLIHEPATMALMISEYRSGRMETAIRDSRLSAEAFGALNRIRRDMLGQFGRDPDDQKVVRAEITDYLDFIYCTSGIFNSGVCADWQADR